MVLLTGLAIYWKKYFGDKNVRKRSRTGCCDEIGRSRDTASMKKFQDFLSRRVEDSSSEGQLNSQENLVSLNEVRIDQSDCRIIDLDQETIERKVGDCMKKMKAMEQKMLKMNKRIEKCEKPEQCH